MAHRGRPTNDAAKIDPVSGAVLAAVNTGTHQIESPWDQRGLLTLDTKT